MTPDPIPLAERLLAVLDRGNFVSTYKYATLLGLIDLCLEHTTATGAPPTSVTTAQLADKVLALYWTHAGEMDIGAVPIVLAQNQPQKDKSGVPEIIRDIARFRDRHAPDPSSTMIKASRAAPAHWERLRRAIEWKLVEMPLPKLQRIGAHDDLFLYVIGWSDDVKKSAFNAPAFDNLVRFVPGAAEALVRLAGLLRPLIQREWAALVARFNGLPESVLEEKLFGVDRAHLAKVRGPLAEVQHGRCFYCERRAGLDDSAVDHFIPWARHANDAMENLVLAHSSCNGWKSDHLAAPRHVQRWLARNEARGTELAQVAELIGWEHDSERSAGVARGIYLRLPGSTPLWVQHKDFAANDVGTTRALFAG